MQITWSPCLKVAQNSWYYSRKGPKTFFPPNDCKWGKVFFQLTKREIGQFFTKSISWLKVGDGDGGSEFRLNTQFEVSTDHWLLCIVPRRTLVPINVNWADSWLAQKKLTTTKANNSLDKSFSHSLAFTCWCCQARILPDHWRVSQASLGQCRQAVVLTDHGVINTSIT